MSTIAGDASGGGAVNPSVADLAVANDARSENIIDSGKGMLARISTIIRMIPAAFGGNRSFSHQSSVSNAIADTVAEPSVEFNRLPLTKKRKRIVIVVENLPLPFDRRVWQECKALVADGWEVSAICPKSSRHPESFELIEGVSIYRHGLPIEARGIWAFLIEYVWALFHEARLLTRIAFRQGFDVIQACNPPDLIFLVAAPFKLFGKKMIFDHHDSAPDLYLAKFHSKDAFYHLLVAAEWMTLKLADRIVTANETYRDHVIKFAKRAPEDVTTVYSIPDTGRLRRVDPDMNLRANAQVVLGYVGIIGDQDGVDHLVRLVDTLVKMGRIEGVRAVIVGDGPALASVKALAKELDVEAYITFAGYLSGEPLLAALSCFDIGIIPDPVNPYNDRISMNKVFEYSALGIPAVAYNLGETRRLLGETACYADDDTPEGLARAALKLIENDEVRQKYGAAAKQNANEKFRWDQESVRYVDTINMVAPANRKAARKG